MPNQNSLGRALKRRASSEAGPGSLIDRAIDTSSPGETKGRSVGGADVSVLSGFRSEPSSQGNPVNEDRSRQKTRRKAMEALGRGFGNQRTL